jgi:hypothetical protein
MRKLHSLIAEDPKVMTLRKMRNRLTIGVVSVPKRSLHTRKR